MGVLSREQMEVVWAQFRAGNNLPPAPLKKPRAAPRRFAVMRCDNPACGGEFRTTCAKAKRVKAYPCFKCNNRGQCREVK